MTADSQYDLVLEQIRAIRADQAELSKNDAELATLLAAIQLQIAELLKRLELSD